MSDFDKPTSDKEWAEKKRLLIHCPGCGQLIDPNLKCERCEAEKIRKEPPPKNNV